jgi:site-specific DNA recombinase
LFGAIVELDKLKIGFKSVTESIDTTSSTGRFVLTCLGAIAEMERETIKERTMGGRAKSARDGKWMTGVPPYGYNLDKETKKLNINKEEAKWIKTFFKWIVVDRLSLREVQQKANEMKIPLPRRNVSEKIRLNHWHKRTIGRMLTNETYTGTAYFGKYKRPFKNLTSLIDESLLRDKKNWIVIQVPPIISRDLFDQCIQQLIKNREFSKRNQKRIYLFSKIVYCGGCGFKLFGGYQPSRKENTAGSKYYHGVCSKEVGSSKRCETCEQIAEVRLMPIWDQLKEILKKPEITLNKLAKYNSDKVERDDTKDELDQVNKTLPSIVEKRQRLAILYADGEIEHDDYKKALVECKTQEEQLRQDQLRLERKLLTRKEIKEVANIINEQYKRLVERLDSLTYDEKQEAMRLVLRKIIVYPKKAEAEVELNFNPWEEGIVSPFSGIDAILRDNGAKNGLTISGGVEGVTQLRDSSVR